MGPAGEGRDFGVLGAGGEVQGVLEEGIPASRIHFVLLEGSPELIAKRLAARHHEFMNASLLASQLATLEPPTERMHCEW